MNSMGRRGRFGLAVLMGGLGLAMAGAGIVEHGASAQPEAAAIGLPESTTKMWVLRSASGESQQGFATRFGGIRTFTRPGQDAEMGFQLPTRITEILVSGDARVSEGDLLMRGDDKEETETVELQRLRAETDLPILRAAEQVKVAQLEYEETKDAFDNDAATQQQMNRAEASLAIAKIDEETAKLNKKQEEIGLRRLQQRLERLRLRAPFDGRVAEISVDVGDTVQETQPVVRVVSLNPLRIDVNAPIDDIAKLDVKNGDTAWALIARPEAMTLVEAIVIEVSPAADFATRKRRVRLEVPNPIEAPSGLAAYVRFDAPPKDMLEGAEPVEAPAEVTEG